MTRWKASSIHLGLSAFVTSTIALVLVWRWYPPGFFHMAHADKLLVLMGGIDVVLGPLLTCIVFTPGKSLRTLRFDLTAIALMQICALSYGMYTVWKSRPVYLVASERSIDLVFANEIDAEKLARAPAEYRRLPAFGPRTVSMLVPAELNSLLAGITGERYELDPSNYRPYAEIVPQLKKNARGVDQLLLQVEPAARAPLASAVRSAGIPESKEAALPVRSSRGNALMLLDLRNGELLRPVAVEWPTTSGGAKPDSKN